MPGGRPSIYTQELATEICNELIEGKSLREICRRKDMPDLSTVLDWAKNKEEFSVQYMRARDMQAEGFVDQLLDITKQEDDTAKARLMSDNIKWIACKVIPKKYGDKTQLQNLDKDGEPADASITVKFK